MERLQKFLRVKEVSHKTAGSLNSEEGAPTPAKSTPHESLTEPPSYSLRATNKEKTNVYKGFF